MESGSVRTYLASLEDLMLKVMGVSSAGASSAMVSSMALGNREEEELWWSRTKREIGRS